jgi:hypothetical protein
MLTLLSVIVGFHLCFWTFYWWFEVRPSRCSRECRKAFEGIPRSLFRVSHLRDCPQWREPMTVEEIKAKYVGEGSFKPTPIIYPFERRKNSLQKKGK